MVFDQATPLNGKENTKQTLYNSKGFQARTQITHPNYIGDKAANHKAGILMNDKENEEVDMINEDLSHIKNVLPMPKGLEIRPSKTP